MSADQRARISTCEWLKAALRDPKLQGLLVSFCNESDKCLLQIVFEFVPIQLFLLFSPLNSDAGK